MSEIVAVCRAWQAASRAREATYLATVVGVVGSSYRRPGARLLFTRDDVLAGAISGGCLERELLMRGAWLAREGPTIATFDARSDDEERPGSGCHGKLDVLVEPLAPDMDAKLELIGSALDAEERVALATVLDGKPAPLRLGARVVKTERVFGSDLAESELSVPLHQAVTSALATPRFRTTRFQGSGAAALVELLEPPPHLSIFGSGPDVVPVARLATSLGWGVTVVAPPGRPLLRARFAGVADLSERSLEDEVARLERRVRPLSLVLAHDYAADRAALGALLSSRVPYIGVLGPTERTARMLNEIETACGRSSDARKAAVFAPAGLALGAETSAEIALSIVAEAQAVLSGGKKTPLRDARGPIHGHASLGAEPEQQRS